MKIVYAFFIGLCGAGSYAIMNMLFFPHADPKIGLIFFAVMFLSGFVIGLLDYDKKKRKKEEEARRQAEKEETDRLAMVMAVVFPVPSGVRDLEQVIVYIKMRSNMLA